MDKGITLGDMVAKANGEESKSVGDYAYDKIKLNWVNIWAAKFNEAGIVT